jgi:hypothetical protein
VEAGQTKHIKCGRVLFTVSTEFYDKDRVPSQAVVAAQIGAIAVTTAFASVLAGAAIGGLTGISAVKSVKVDGLYADGKTVVIGGRLSSDAHAYELFVHRLEKL